jgi:SAM-dependent methyltransferase
MVLLLFEYAIGLRGFMSDINKSDEVYSSGLLSRFLEAQRMKQASRFIKSGHQILDLACNEGRLLEFIPSQIQYVGIDIQQKAIEQARNRYPQHQFLVADLTQELGVAAKQFDVIVMLAFLEHIEHPAEMLKLYKKYLKPDGKIVITTPAPIGRRIHDIGARLGIFSKEAAAEHETFLDKQHLMAIGEQANLSLMLYEHFLLGFNQIAYYTHV